jgi:dUTP pyrophosphatase
MELVYGSDIPVKVKKLRPGAKMPTYADDGAGWFDLYTDIEEPLRVYHGQVVAVPTGIALEIPEGWKVAFGERSGLAKKEGIQILGGKIDGNYRGELIVLVTCARQAHLNTLPHFYTIRPGERICQAEVIPSYRAEFVEVEELSETIRGSRAFGHTGKF